MNRKLAAALVILGCVAVVLAVRDFAPATEPSKAATESGTKIGNGIVLLNLVKGSGMTANQETDFVADAKLVKIGDRTFIRGKGFVAKEYEDDPRAKWYKGVDAFYALDTVTQIIDFTPEQVEVYMASFKKE
jgi:hypothetical protein